MSFSGRVVPLLLLALLSVAVPLRAQAPAKATPKTPKGTVSGRVTIKDKPAPGVSVGLRKVASGAPLEQFLKATTDQNGVYRITNVPPGTYDIVPSAPAFVVVDIGVNYSRGKNVIVGEDEDIQDINFSLVRGGVITGKITDADGRPVIQQQVNLYAVQSVTQQAPRQIYPSTNAQTDDRGIYRFFGLPTGRYKIAAGRADDIYAGTSSQARLIYKQVFHPDVTEQEKATVIDVREGSEANDVDIKLGNVVQTFSASGRVIKGDNGLPLANIRFGLQRNVGERFELVQSYAMSNSAGEFVIDGLAPGKYSVFLYPDQALALRAEAMTFDVIDQDVSGITVKMLKGSSLSGVIVFEHEDKKAWAKLLELKLRGYVTSSGSPLASAVRPAAISADGSFQLSGLSPGTVQLYLATDGGLNAPKGFMISRIEHNGVVRPQGVEIKEGEQLMDVRVFVSYGTGTLRGVVTMDAGLMPEGSRIFARLLRPGTPPIQVVSTSLVDARGHFLMEGVPAGVFELFVSLAGGSMRSRPPAVKQDVTIQDGVTTEVSVTLDLAPQPKP